jgi:hypothetical protein
MHHAFHYIGPLVEPSQFPAFLETGCIDARRFCIMTQAAGFESSSR